MIIKVCGMTRAEDVEFCDRLGIDLLGFIFHPESPRNVAPEWVASQKPGRALKTGVFVRQSVEEVSAMAKAAGLDLLQLHGGHTVEQCRDLGPERVIKTMWPQRYPSTERLLADMLLFAPVCRAILLDSGKSGGGHGTSINPADLRRLNCPHPWYLAGGLGPHNLDTMKTTGASGFDLNSGVEKLPGIKDHEKIRTALHILRGKP
jgi:phosphoribosylanthranilate isomerase